MPAVLRSAPTGYFHIPDRKVESKSAAPELRPESEWQGESEVVPAWGSDNVVPGEEDLWKSGAVGKESNTIRLDKDAADRLGKDKKGRLIPYPVNGGIDKGPPFLVHLPGIKTLLSRKVTQSGNQSMPSHAVIPSFPSYLPNSLKDFSPQTCTLRHFMPNPLHHCI